MLKETLKWRTQYKPEEIRWEEIAREAETEEIYRANYTDKYRRTVLVMRPSSQQSRGFIRAYPVAFLFEKVLLRMASGDDLEFSFLDLPETFGALTDCGGNFSLLVSENEHSDFVGIVPFSAATSDVFSSPLMENSNTDQETLTRTSSFDQETAIVTQKQSFHDQEDDYSKYFNTAENFHGMVRTIAHKTRENNMLQAQQCRL